MNANIGIDIGKRKCDYGIVNEEGAVVDRGQYRNTAKDAKGFARGMVTRYGRKCRAACETTARMWLKTYEAFESAGVDIKVGGWCIIRLYAARDKLLVRSGVDNLSGSCLRLDARA